MPKRHILAAAAGFCLIASVLSGRMLAQGSYLQSLSPEAVESLIASTSPDAPATVTVANRPITVVRAVVLNRSSAERAEGAEALVNTITKDGSEFPVTSRPLGAAAVISVGGHDVLAIVPLDADALQGETVESKSAAAVANLAKAISEIAEVRRPQVLFWAIVESLLATLVFVAAVVALWRAKSWANLAAGKTEQQLARLKVVGDEIARQTKLIHYVGRAANVLLIIAGVVIGYMWLTFVLRRFPYTRPWGESLRALMIERIISFGQRALSALPDLLTIALIIIITRFAIRILTLVFAAVESGRVNMMWIYPETAAPTRKLLTGLLWLFALVVAYPYFPGSETAAFQGVSVFVGLMVSLGSSGLLNQIMSGFTLTYSRALRRGDFVKVGDVEGTVSHMGTLSTKVVTPRREEITIPNAVLIGQEVTNFSRNAADGVQTPVQVTIGYDAPWRKVHQLLLHAASLTSGIRPEPPPVVFQSALEDSYVRYSLLVCLVDPAMRASILNMLHANIQDAFNAAGIQIMSPNYEGDPEAPKMVPKEKW